MEIERREGITMGFHYKEIIEGINFEIFEIDFTHREDGTCYLALLTVIGPFAKELYYGLDYLAE